MSAWECQFAAAGLGAEDVYRLHQTVWDMVSPAARDRADRGNGRFLWSWSTRPGGVVFHVRAPWRSPLARPARLPRSGHLRCRLAAGRQSETSALTPIEDDTIEAWFRERMNASGLDVSDVVVSPIERVSGRKVGHNILLPTRRFAASFEVGDSELAWQAFTQGVGRSRGFGCGMLLVSAGGGAESDHGFIDRRVAA